MGAFRIKKFNIQLKAEKNGVKHEVSLTDHFMACLVYTTNMYSNGKNCENIFNYIRVFQQNINSRKIKSVGMRTSLNDSFVTIT